MKKVFHGMFARLMTVMLAAILACVLVLYSLFYFTIRADHIDARMNELKRQAYDIAYLASRVHNNSIADPSAIIPPPKTTSSGRPTRSIPTSTPTAWWWTARARPPCTPRPS